MNETTVEKHAFQAEIRQLLDLVVHSLYTEKEIFLRELVSNASDSMERLRLVEAVEKEVSQPDLPHEIRISTDEEAGTLVIADHGTGMTREELVRNLGTIAHSGTKAFLEAAKESGQPASALIGQFGVGFYSAFMVAERVTVHTRSWHAGAPGLVWSSDGQGGYEIEEADGVDRGARIVLKLKDSCKEFAGESRVRNLIETYSNFVGFPVLLNGKRVNEVGAVWLRNKSEVSEEEYKEFYRFACKAWDDPAYRLHFSADAPIAINALVFAPAENPERMGFTKAEPAVALYCRKVLIDSSPKGLLPEWMRFLKGVVDSPDIPLNISRETMQDSALVRKLGGVVAKRVVRMFEKEAESDPERYRSYYRKFERFFKEGVVTDHTHRDSLAKLLRFESSLTAAGETCGLADYLSRMREGQEAVYYLAGASREAAADSPYLEAFRSRGIEVLYFTDPVDEYVADSLGKFEGKELVSVRQAGLDLGESAPEGESLPQAELDALCAFLGKELDGRVVSVRSGARLEQSPVIALLPKDAPGPQIRQMMKAMDENYRDEVKVELEINPRHALIRSLSAASQGDPELAGLVARQLLDNALISAGLLEDARDTVARMNRLMERAMGKGS
jgi:TNF receptor-associated protein 1